MISSIILYNERTSDVRLHGYVEVVANLSYSKSRRNFLFSCDTFEWLLESLENRPEMISEKVGKS